MKKKILYLIGAILLSLGLSVFAQTPQVFDIDDAFFGYSNINSGDYSILHFNYGGNDMLGLMFLGTGINQTGELTLGGQTISCNKQLNGLYINPARGNRIWPLDGEILDNFSGAGLTGYDEIELEGGLFTECSGTGISNDGIYGYIKHTYMGIEYELWAGIDYNLNDNLPLGQRSGSLNYLTFNNISASGYLFDANGGIANVYSNLGEIYTVTFSGNGGDNIQPPIKIVQNNTAIGQLATADKTGYTLSGWFTAAIGGVQITGGTIVTENTTYYAQWIANRYQIKFDANGGAGTMPNQEFVYDTAENISTNTFTKTNHTFTRWNTQSNGLGNDYNNNQNVSNLITTGIVTLYAQWSQDGIGACGIANNIPRLEAPDTNLCDAGIPSGVITSLSGFNWTCTEQGEPVNCSAPRQYNVIFSGNGGTTPNPENKIVTYNSAIGQLATTSRAEYTFNGWFTATVGGTLVTENKIVTGENTYYAQWTENALEQLSGNFVFTGNGITWDGYNQNTSYAGIMVNIMSNKNAQFQITGDIISAITGSLNGGVAVDKNIMLTSNTGIKNLYLIIFTGGETYQKSLSIRLNDAPIIDTTPPIVTLTSPSSGSIINLNSVNLIWSGSDNIGITNYAVYITGASTSYTLSGITTTGIEVTPILNGYYTWSVIGKDANGNIGNSQTRGFTISGNVTGPTLISPTSGSNINIGSLSLLWSPINGSTSGYNWQISTNTGFTNVVLSGYTNSTGLTVTHTPNFMTGTYYWRVIDKKTAGASDYRTVNIVNLTNGVDTKINQFTFNDVTGANVSDVYASNTIVISGLTNNVSVLARLENNVGALFINNVMVGSSGLVKNSDQIKIELTSSNGYNNMVSSKLLAGEGANLMSGTFRVYTKSGIDDVTSGSLSSIQRLQIILIVESIVKVYKDNPEQLFQFLTTFKNILKDQSDLLAATINSSISTTERAIAQQNKDVIDFLYSVVDIYLRDMSYTENNINIYTAPNGKKYIVQYNTEKGSYTSPDFMRAKYFPTWELFKNHIDVNNPGNYYNGTVGDNITTPSGKKYVIHNENGKWTSNNMLYKKYFDNRDQIIEHLVINNPAANWDHDIDTSFSAVKFIAPNGRSYTIFKTKSTGNNPNKYSSFMFVAPKYFGSLQAAKDHITKNNR